MSSVPALFYGEVSSIRVAGQELMVTAESIDMQLFGPDSQSEGYRGLGVPLKQSQEVDIVVATSGGGFGHGVAINTDPWNIAEQGQIPPVNSLGEDLNYAGGFGRLALAAASTGVLSVRVLEDVRIGLMAFASSDIANELTINSIKINNKEMLSGAAANQVGFETFAPTCTDIDGRYLDYIVATNDEVSITFENHDAVTACNVGGGFFCDEIFRDAA